MCPHDSFKILYYNMGVLVRRCQGCGQIEVAFDFRWTSLDCISQALTAIEKDGGN